MRRLSSGSTRRERRSMVAETVVAPSVRVMLDTNVVLDLLLEREPWLSEAQKM